MPVDYSQDDVADQIFEMRGGDGVHKSIEAAGYQAHDGDGVEHHAMVVLSACHMIKNEL